MAKKRYINTVFWNDSYVADLDPSEKLLYLYLITNPATNICGIYQVPLKRMATDTGIEKEMCQKILDRFQRDEKILYDDGWIAIRNFLRHQNFNSPMIQTSFEREMTECPRRLLDFIDIPYEYGIDTASQDASKYKSKSKSFLPPTLVEIQEYIKLNSLDIDAKFFLKYFTDGDWTDSRGNKVKNWKQKLLTWNKHNNGKPKQKEPVDLSVVK